MTIFSLVTTVYHSAILSRQMQPNIAYVSQTVAKTWDYITDIAIPLRAMPPLEL